MSVLRQGLQQCSLVLLRYSTVLGARLWHPYRQADTKEYCTCILHTDRSGIRANLADPDCSGIHPCLRHTLGMPGRLAGHCTYCNGKLFRHQRLPAVLWRIIPCIRCRRYCRAAIGRFHKNINRVIHGGLSLCPCPRSHRFDDCIDFLKTAPGSSEKLILFIVPELVDGLPLGYPVP